MTFPTNPPPTTPFQVRAPGRINLIGEHVDYQGGCVLPFAIDRAITGAFTALDAPQLQLRSAQGATADYSCDLADLAPQTGAAAWTNYVTGVVAVYRDEGIVCPGFSASFASDLPAGAGLSSSAALETATALAVEHLAGVTLDPAKRAQLCQRAEHTYAGVPCGIMDQMAVGMSKQGHALMIDCHSLATEDVLLPEELAIVVANTGVQHALADGAYKARRADVEAAASLLEVEILRDASAAQVAAAADALGDPGYRRARHVVAEIARVADFATALSVADYPALGQLMRASHDSLRDDFEVSCAELDLLVDAAYAFGSERGMVGSRMTGGGFGGSTVSLVRHEAVEAYIAHLQAAYQDAFDTMPTCFTVQASAGAGLV